MASIIKFDPVKGSWPKPGSGEPHHDQPGVGTSLSVWAAPLPNTYTSFSSRGRAQVEPACPPMEDKITPSDLYADIPMTINKPVIQGTMFPNFDRSKFPYRVHSLGQGNDSIRLILFMRINDNLFSYGNEMIRKVISNMNKGGSPSCSNPQMISGSGNPMGEGHDGPHHPLQHQEEIHKLYTMAYDEPENKAPCVCKAQDLVTYINLWKRCRNGGHLFGPPKRHIRKERHSKIRREHLEHRQERVDPPDPKLHQGDLPPISIRDLQSHLDHEEGPAPLEKGQEGPSLSFHKGLHPFAPQSMTGMFPGALGFSSCPDDDEVEVKPPSQQDVQGFLLCKQLALLVCLLTVKGCYRALLEWDEVTPAIGTPAPWEGGLTHLATMADVTAYLVANGITYHNTNDALKWMRATLNEPLPMGKYHLLEWIDLQACMLGVPPESIAPYEVHPIKERDLHILREFAKLAALYDLPHHARGEGSNAGGVLLIPANTLKEGEMEDDLRLM
ncbi:hypothetical protein EDC04DRAFT_2615698 [Pisolithus marmoratus]|nr:hypothetical protein EDC04DRAFT_2615698 [Pisolithus marmoratus]